MSDLEKIGEGLDEVLRRLGLPATDVMDRLVRDWAGLAGEPWASRARPAGLHRGELTLEVADGTAASLLRYQSGQLVDRLEQGLGARLVESVHIRLSSPKKRH